MQEKLSSGMVEAISTLVGFDGFQQEHLTIAAGLDFLLKATETSSVGRAVIEG